MCQFSCYSLVNSVSFWWTLTIFTQHPLLRRRVSWDIHLFTNTKYRNNHNFHFKLGMLQHLQSKWISFHEFVLFINRSNSWNKFNNNKSNYASKVNEIHAWVDKRIIKWTVCQQKKYHKNHIYSGLVVLETLD